MKKKNLLGILALGVTLQGSAVGQEVHSDLKTVASKVNMKGEYVQLNRLSGDIGALTEYFDLVLETARANGEKIPAGINAKDLMNVLGLNDLKAIGSSCEKVDNAWVNRLYIDNGGSDKGIFSVLGQKNSEFVAPKSCPAGTDIVLQKHLDLRKMEQVATAIATMVGEKKVAENMSKPIPQLGMTASEVLAKMNVRINLMIDMDNADMMTTPLGGQLGRPKMALRIDGMTWLWDKMGKDALAQSGAPLDRTEKDGLVFYRMNEQGVEMMKEEEPQAVEMLKLSPVMVIDKAKDQMWITTNEGYLMKCMSGENTLADSAEYKAAMAGLPSTGNSMAYVSKYTLSEISKNYRQVAESGLFGRDFEKGKKIIDRLMVDITESDKGWALTVGRDDNGIAISSRGPIATKHLQYLSGLLPYFALASSSHEMKRAIRAERHNAIEEFDNE